jgi:hypothetical protein
LDTRISALAAVDERVERTDDVVAVHSQIEGEVVARTRRYTCVGQLELCRYRRHDRLRAITARHREPIRAAQHRTAHQGFEVASGP